MTFDDGILKIYEIENVSENGKKPEKMLVKKSEHYFGFETLGIRRYFTALQAQRKIESVVNVPGWNAIVATDICVMEDGCQYKMAMVQLTKDEDDLKITKLSLERLGEDYDFKN